MMMSLVALLLSAVGVSQLVVTAEAHILGLTPISRFGRSGDVLTGIIWLVSGTIAVLA